MKELDTGFLRDGNKCQEIPADMGRKKSCMILSRECSLFDFYGASPPPATSFKRKKTCSDFTDIDCRPILSSVNRHATKFTYFFVTPELNPYSVIRILSMPTAIQANMDCGWLQALDGIGCDGWV